MIPPSAGSARTRGAWFDPSVDPSALRPRLRPSHAEGTTAIRDAMQMFRRAKLTRVVKAVVVASAILCFAALVRVTVALASGPPPQITHAARVFLREAEVASTFRTIHTSFGEPRRPARRPGRRSARSHASR